MKYSRLLIIVFLFNFLNVNGQEPPFAVYEKVKNALVHISSFSLEGNKIDEGTGFFIDPNGILLTTNHLIASADSVLIKGVDGTIYPLISKEIISEKADIVKLQVYKKHGQVSALALSESILYEGDSAFTIGINDKLQGYVSEGYVSIIRIFEETGPGLLTMMKVDKVHDGAPLVNNFGEVIGLFSFPKIELFEINFAISIKVVTESEGYKPAKTSVYKVTEQPETEYFTKDNQKIIENESITFDSIINLESKLKTLGDSIIEGWNEFARLDALTDFIPLFVKALKVRGSYYYSFNKLDFMYKLVSPDNSFRIFNWTLRFDDGTYRYYGAIQFNSINLKLIPLYDYSHMIPFDIVTDTILTQESWYGVQYFDIGIMKKGKLPYYILLGWDGNNYISSKKLVEILHFDENNNAVFGAPLFSVPGTNPMRYQLQFNKDAFVVLKFVDHKKMIAFDNLIPPTPDDSGKFWTYVPDGTYNYLKIKKGKLVFNEDIFKNEKISPDAISEDKNISGKPENNKSIKSGILPPDKY